MIRLLTLCVVFGFVLFADTGTALAAPKSLGTFGYWATYQMNEGNASVCYMSITAKSPPKKGEKKSKRGDVVLMITHRPSEGSTDVVSYSVGAKFKPASDVTVKIGSNSFTMFTQQDAAWAHDSATDRAIAAALRSGASATFTGQLASGTALADTVNLKGAAEAYYAIGKACGLAVSKPKPAAGEAPKTTVKTPSKTPAKATKPTVKTSPKTP